MGKLEETKRISTKQPTTSQTAAPAQTQIHAEEELEELEEHEEVLEELEEHEEIKMPSLEEIAKGMEQEDKKIESSIIAGMNDLVFVELPYTYIMGLAGNAYRGFREFNHAIEVQREALMSPEFIKASNLLKSRGIESKGLIEDRIKGRENLDKARGRMATFYLLDAANPEMLKEDHTIKKMIESIELTPKFISRYQEKVLPKGQAELPDHLLIKEDEILTYTNFSCDKGFNDLKESGRLTDMMLQVHKKMQEAVTGSKRTLETPTGDYEPEPAAQDTKPANSAKKTLADILPEKRTINMLISSDSYMKMQIETLDSKTHQPIPGTIGPLTMAYHRITVDTASGNKEISFDEIGIGDSELFVKQGYGKTLAEYVGMLGELTLQDIAPEKLQLPNKNAVRAALGMFKIATRIMFSDYANAELAKSGISSTDFALEKRAAVAKTYFKDNVEEKLKQKGLSQLSALYNRVISRMNTESGDDPLSEEIEVMTEVCHTQMTSKLSPGIVILNKRKQLRTAYDNEKDAKKKEVIARGIEAADMIEALTDSQRSFESYENNAGVNLGTVKKYVPKGEFVRL